MRKFSTLTRPEREYNLVAPCAVHQTFLPSMHGKLRNTSKIEDLYSNVVGNGLCGYLCLCQAIPGDKWSSRWKMQKIELR